MNMFKPTKATDIKSYVDAIDEPRKNEIIKLDKFIKKTVPTLKPWFAYNMLGYGTFHYKTKSGSEGDWPIIALASQKNYISVYVCGTDGKQYTAEKYAKDLKGASVGKSCIRYKKFEDIDLKMLAKVIKEGKTANQNGMAFAEK